MPETFIEIGRIRSVNPARREVRITPRAGYAAAFDKLNWLTTQRAGDDPTRARLDKIEVRGKDVVATLGAVVPRDTVAGMNRTRVLVPENDAPEPDIFAVDPAELKGFVVVDAGDHAIGTIAGGFVSGDNRVVEIDRPGTSSLLAPLIPEVVVSADWQGERVVVSDLEDYAVEHDSGSRTV